VAGLRLKWVFVSVAATLKNGGKVVMMRGFLSAFLILVFLSAPAFAEDALSGVLLDGEQTKVAIEKLRTQHAGIESFSAVTLQTRSSALLDQELRTEGVIVLKKPNLLRWDIERPSRLVIAVDGAVMWIYRPDRKEVEKRILSDDPVARYAMKFFASTMNFSMRRLSKRFFVELYRGDGVIILSLRPRSKMAARHLESISIWYSESDGSPVRLVLRSKNKGITTTEFAKVRLNVEVDTQSFTLVLPDDVLVIGQEEDEDF
jgi:outer membrane lipoprotein-sorting protein